MVCSLSAEVVRTPSRKDSDSVDSINIDLSLQSLPFRFIQVPVRTKMLAKHGQRRREVARSQVRSRVHEAKGNISPPKNSLPDSDKAKNTDTNTNVFPVETSALVQMPRLISKEPAETDHTHQVRDDKGAGTPVAQGGELARQPVVGLAALLDGPLLGRSGFGAGLFLFLLPLFLAADAVCLGLGLDLLLLVVRGDGADGGGVDVYQRGRGGFDVGLDGGRHGGSSLRYERWVS
ncbi:hypothetical protein SODALDRAFT_57674 [Sodiomyces alkalinus F11]|uniref:Uncharacterized protein n=1 Tax=Sodiomyces alkalinus (strain CBS 110278 / VKM F-3762 / F11) TaxID=1314773 RepID=A0A3N2PNI2_SODAK|nr:hypothetical protein SODALDRAFT_57674 [Sodiomyces alkalinus F11]ROT36087.1 hypothetical protein SODALDRAFT_57674 [Sodiomyces alkalinus F11]